MNMKTTRILYGALLLLFFTLTVHAQEHKVSGKILSSLNQPIEGAIISISGIDDVLTNADGTFHLDLKNPEANMTVWAAGYNSVNRLVKGQSDVVIMMVPSNTYKYNESAVLPFRIENTRAEKTSAVNITKKDFTLGSMKIDRALSGQVAGLRTTRMGGMPGEGSYMNLRGIRSMVGTNAPLVVINGVPYLPDSKESQLVNGYTKDIFLAYNIGDIQNITVLKGAEAAMYGSMGANGVILIETDGANSDNLETKVSFWGQYGVNWNNKRMPLLKGNDYKSYLSDVGMTYFNTMEGFFNEFPFLSDPNSKYNYLYNNVTDWQDLIYKKGFVTDNLFRVEGGDAIAKYDISLGYALENGLMDYTQSQRYHTQLNTSVLVSKQVELFATIGLAYMNGEYQEQGMIPETNPILAAYARAPLLSPYGKDVNGNTLASYSSYYYGKSNNMDFATSNPLAIINTLDGRNRQYDVSIKAGIAYKPLLGLTFTGTFGLYYNYNKEQLFIPGLTEQTILPFFDQYGEAKNTVKAGVGETFNLFTNLNGHYQKTFNHIHQLNVLAGMQMVMTKNEYDAGIGRNTPNDFYQTLNSTTNGRYFYGFLDKWNWMNFYGHADYTYNNKIAASVNVAVDGASSSGTYGNHFHLYPSVGLTWLGKGWLALSNSTLVNRLNVRAEYGLTGNSRFSSSLGKYYYTSLPYQDISGIVRANVSNTKLKPEKNAQLNIGLDMSLLHNRLELTFDYYNSQSTDVIFAKPQSSVYGTTPYYENCGKIENQGVELSIQGSLIRTANFEWILGGNIARNKAKVKSLGSDINQLTNNYSDGSSLLTQVGADPYQFYGYQALGVFSTQNDANKAGLVNQKNQQFQAGDVHYVDQNGDGRIDDKDRVALGTASPNYFGGFFTRISYKAFALSAEFAYSKGNKAYNAVRRNLESLSTMGNQSVATMNRWTVEGQETSIPRAQWGDPIGNSDFSSRWIEDASYLRMKNITFSYSFDKKFLNFFRSGTIYVTGENLLTATKYLGLDPEFSYSYSDAMQGFDYAKMIQPKSIKFGVNLNF